MIVPAGPLRGLWLLRSIAARFDAGKEAGDAKPAVLVMIRGQDQAVLSN
jgi:hypothetical protein